MGPPYRLSYKMILGDREMKSYFIGLVLLFLTACNSAVSVYKPPEDVEARIHALMDEYNAATVGVGIIKSEKLVWTGYYGQQSPRIATNSETMFNTASTNKAVTAETALRLASRGVIDLDEPISDYYIYPDIKDDPRHKLLTPRILLSHQAGFMNWPYLYEDEILAFIDEPGNGVYNYAGIGFRIFAKFLEAKLEKPFPQIVHEEIFDPIGMEHATNSHDEARHMGTIVTPVDKNGNFESDYMLREDYWSAADDLFVSVEDYASFLISVMKNEAVNSGMIAERQRVHTEMSGHEIWACAKDGVDPCPSPYGHSIGWFVFGYEDGLVLHHGGNDKSEGAIAYFEPSTGDGGIIFVNSPQGVQLWPEIAEIIDPEQPITDVFQDLIRKFF